MIRIVINNTQEKKIITDYKRAIVLEYDNWNDYGYYTSYNMFYCSDEGVKNKIGLVKIYSQKLDLDDSEPAYIDSSVGSYIEKSEIDLLLEDFCSLGQNLDYYQNLKKFFPNECVDILRRLRDLAIDDTLKNSFICYKGVQESLLRDKNAREALEEAKRVLDIDILNEDGLEDYATIDEINNQNVEDIYPYPSIKIERDQYSVFELNRKYERKRICLDPSFQRHFVWNLKQQSELIESIIMGIPLPLIYLAENRDGQLVVVDGQQRLTTFIRFLGNKFRLMGLNILTNLNGKNYAELEKEYPNYISIIEDYQLVIQVIKYPTPDRIRFDIFDRVNRGGTHLNKQEMRNALYQGAATRLLEDLANSEEFIKATGGAISVQHMKDRYIVLRAIAFCLVFQKKLKDKRGNLIEYKSDMDDLMGKAMEYLNECQELERQNILNEYKMIMKRCYQVLGEDAFRVPNESGRKRPISMTLFETIYYLMFLTFRKDISDSDIKETYRRLLDDKIFMDAVQYSVDSSKNVDIRFERVRHYVEGM